MLEKEDQLPVMSTESVLRAPDSTATLVSPAFSPCDLSFLLPNLSAYFANAVDRADLTVSSGSFFLRLLASSSSFSTSVTSFMEEGSLPFEDVSGTTGRLEITRLNGS